MKTSILITVLALTVLLLAGCATDNQQAPGKGGALTQLDVFRDGNKPSRPYKEIRLLTDEGKAVEQVAIEDKMRKKAQALGGAGIIFFSREETGAEMSGLFGVAKTFLYKASVIVYSQ